MALDLIEALEALKTIPATPEALRALVAQVAVDTTGTVTLAYSGMFNEVYSGDLARAMAVADPNIRIIDNTAASVVSG